MNLLSTHNAGVMTIYIKLITLTFIVHLINAALFGLKEKRRN